MSRDIDIRLLTADQIAETDESRAARRAAEGFGAVTGSSYSTFEGRPVLWAFDVEHDHRRLIVAGGEHVAARVLLFADPDEAFTTMLYGKALAGYSRDALEPHSVTQIDRVPEEVAWFCDSFYLARQRVGGMREDDVVAVALHAREAGMQPDAAEAAVLERSPDLVSTADPDAARPGFRGWVKLVRTLRRITRLRALSAPDVMVERDLALARQTWQEGALGWVSWPADLRGLAEELGLVQG